MAYFAMNVEFIAKIYEETKIPIKFYDECDIHRKMLRRN